MSNPLVRKLMADAIQNQRGAGHVSICGTKARDLSREELMVVVDYLVEYDHSQLGVCAEGVARAK
jgi:hypothetical protein